ncbi:hypothetical protein RO575_15840 [Methylomonas sp. MO1]|uniref:hypothetical protein n=1 Tax=unclassified Methylomonas TaxID=2608980 RepID=UPI00047E43DF|nr:MULTISPECIES: hypothetical protein [unclassified Methylomonas]MDT4291039.1 hypothetical protein [Methylomonas sp. MO1]
MNHEVIAARVEHIAMATGIIAGLSAVAATIATPTGLTAFGVWLGLVDEPLIVTVAPILDKLATVCGTISGMTYFYAVRKKRQTAKQSVSDNSAPSD